MLCSRPNCEEKEDRIDGYCSIYCRDIHEVEQQRDEALTGIGEEALRRIKAEKAVEDTDKRIMEYFIGLTVHAKTGDGDLKGVIRSVDEYGVTMQVGQAWYEGCTWECLYANPLGYDENDR